MKRHLLYLAALAVILPGRTVMAQQADAFAACVTTSGEEYRKARDAFLKLPADPKFLREKLKSKELADRLTARILLGWQEHAGEYRKLLDAPKLTLQEGTLRYRWSLEPGGITPAAVPLMYELLMKDIERGAAWDAAHALTSLVMRQPKTPLDVVLLHRYLRDQGENEPMSRRATAWLIGELPANYQAPQELLATLEDELESKKQPKGTVLPLLDGLAVAAEGLPPEERDQIVSRLQAIKPLEGMLGKTKMTYALAGVGGDKASRVVADYLEKAPEEGEKTWALRALAKADSEVATEVLLRYTEDDRESLRRTAVAGLEHTRFTPAVGAKLEQIALSDNVPRPQQREAIYSLATISVRHRDDEDVQKSIKSRLQKISASKKDKKFQEELDQYIRELESHE